jgi:uncharacterized protein
MYMLALVALLVVAARFVVGGVRRKSRGRIIAGATMAIATLGAFALLGFWGEMLWFEEVGFLARFWTEAAATVAVAGLGAALAAGLVAAITLPARKTARHARYAGVALAAVLGAIWGASSWSLVLRWALRVTTDMTEPILGHDTGFYLFTLPLMDALLFLFSLVIVVSVGVAMWSAAGIRAGPQLRLVHKGEARETASNGVVPKRLMRGAWRNRPLNVTAGALALLLAGFAFVARYHLFYSDVGTVHGPGWTDVRVRLPIYTGLAFLLGAIGVLLIVPRSSRFLEAHAPRQFARSPIRALVLPVLAAATVWFVGLGILPVISQWLKVTPNELALERPYIANSIAFTRRGFGIDRVEERPFEASGHLTQQVVDGQKALLSEVRLWDPRALHQVLDQFQVFRLYYELAGIDVDRYVVDGRYRQMMVAPREIQPNNLPEGSQTFVNRHFQYTHGYGLAMAPVSDFTKDGLPELVVRDLPPVATHPSLAIERPEIYYGELTNDFVVVNSNAREFDYPSGNDNVYTHYQGKGGVELSSLLRRIAFGWKLGGTRLLFSSYPTDDSRIMFHRNVKERVERIAPFLTIDRDPYLVIADGRLKWIVDAYTTSAYFPYSESLSGVVLSRTGEPLETAPEDGDSPELMNVNYLRNSVKVVVDAYDGSVALYAFDEEDPVLRVWRRIYPHLIQPQAAMAPSLRAHVRYPEQLMSAQGRVYAKFHMTDADVFYNQEDLWVRAREERRTREGRAGVVEPYYVMWQPDGADRLHPNGAEPRRPAGSGVEFILMQPYTPKNRQVLNGWLAGMCDGAEYGRLLAYRFSKDKWILGPQQVDTKIDQSPELSAQLTLWDQHGKRVIRGNILAIPIDETILYVEPIYLQAEAAAYPELRTVVTMEGETMAYAPTFEEALARLVSAGVSLPTTETSASPAAPDGSAHGISSAALERARQAFDAYRKLTSEGRFEEAGAELRRLGEALERERNQANARPPPAPHSSTPSPEKETKP